MLVALPDRLKYILTNFANKFKPLIHKYRLVIFAGVLLPIMLFVLPGFLINLFIDKNEINKQIQRLSETGNVLFSSDGIVKNPFRDVTIYNVRIKEKSENSNQQSLLTVPELRITPDIFQSISRRSLVVKNITLKDARWKFSGKDNYIGRELQSRVLNFLGQKTEFKIILQNNIVTIYFDKKNYEHQVWNILVDKGLIASEKNGVNIFVHYRDLPWGNGSLAFSPSLCKECNLLHGKYNIDLHKLPLNRLSWFFDPLKMKNGFIDIKSNLEYSINDGDKKKDEIDLESKIRLDNVQITDASNLPVLENSRIELNIKYQNKNDAILSEFSGIWRKTPFEGKLLKSKKSVYPESLKFSVNNRNENTIPLLFGFKLDGLKYIHFDMHEDPDKKIYRILGGDFLTSNGGILDSNNLVALKLPNVSLKLENNRFTGNINLAKNKSDLQLDFTGSVLPINKTIDTLIEFEDYQRNQPFSYNGVAFEIEESGQLNSENLYWGDIEPYYKYFKKIWNKSVKNDEFRGWRPSIFRERDWFQKYMVRTSLNNTLSFKNWRYTGKENQSIAVTGSLVMNNSFLDLTLNGGSDTVAIDATDATDAANVIKTKKQNFNMEIDMTGNTPVFRGEYRLIFPELDKFSSAWLPFGLISGFTESTVENKFTSSGEHPVDLLNNFNATGNIRLQNAVLILENKKTSETFTTMNLDLRSFGEKYQVNMNGENDTAAINGWGSYDKENNGWKLNTTILQKRQ